MANTATMTGRDYVVYVTYSQKDGRGHTLQEDGYKTLGAATARIAELKAEVPNYHSADVLVRVNREPISLVYTDQK